MERVMYHSIYEKYAAPNEYNKYGNFSEESGEMKQVSVFVDNDSKYYRRLMIGMKKNKIVLEALEIRPARIECHVTHKKVYGV